MKTLKELLDDWKETLDLKGIRSEEYEEGFHDALASCIYDIEKLMDTDKKGYK